MQCSRICWLLALGLLAGCTDDERIVRYPIEAFLLQYVDPVIAASLCNPGPNFVSIGAQVGYDDCELESSQVLVQGDSLFISGVARCVVRRTQRLTGAPARNNPRLLSVPLPQLDPGDYILCADGLCGPLSVTPACRPALSTKLYAYGEFGVWDACSFFRTDLAFRQFEPTGVEVPAPTGRVRIFATPTCSTPYCGTICNPSFDGVIQVWIVEPVP